MTHKKVDLLVVDDEWNMRNLIKLYLDKQDWSITEAATGTEALAKLQHQSFDLVILDVMMPGMDGWEVCQLIRKKWDIPILLLTARNETKDKVHGLNLGADDYLTKPFEPDELIARIHALLRRARVTTSTDERTIRLDGITINPDSRQVFVNGKEVFFTPKEFDLLYLLAKNPTRVYSRETLLEQVWGHDFFGDQRTVDQHIKNIREKVKKCGSSFNPIKTVWGVGYKIQRIDDV